MQVQSGFCTANLLISAFFQSLCVADMCEVKEFRDRYVRLQCGQWQCTPSSTCLSKKCRRRLVFCRINVPHIIQRNPVSTEVVLVRMKFVRSSVLLSMFINVWLSRDDSPIRLLIQCSKRVCSATRKLDFCFKSSKKRPIS